MKQDLLHLEVAAENLDAAVEKALTQLNCTRAEADVEVLQVPSSGFLGLFGKRQARVRVNLHDRGAIARQFTDSVLRLSGPPQTRYTYCSPRTTRACSSVVMARRWMLCKTLSVQ